MNKQMMLEENILEVEALENLAKGFSSLALLAKNPVVKFLREFQLGQAQSELDNARRKQESLRLKVLSGV